MTSGIALDTSARSSERVQSSLAEPMLCFIKNTRGWGLFPVALRP
jgi:hypothetical protein